MGLDVARQRCAVRGGLKRIVEVVESSCRVVELAFDQIPNADMPTIVRVYHVVALDGIVVIVFIGVRRGVRSRHGGLFWESQGEL